MGTSRKRMLLWMILGTLLLVGGTAQGAVMVSAGPMLVTQPVYAGMSFHVFRPASMPNGWYVTYDGYPVMMASGGVWYYGSVQGAAILPTSYVVGSVVPTTLPLVPYAAATATPQIPSQPQAPVTLTPSQVYVPGWLMNGNFTSVARWRHQVNRMAMLDKPRVPLAWKGDNPEVVFAWTGRSWYAMRTREAGGPAEVLRNNIYALTRMVNQNGLHWNDADTPILANQSFVWGYLWMGRISPVSR